MKRFILLLKVIVNSWPVFAFVFQDQDTGVLYIGGSHGGFAPRLNSDGSLYIMEVD